MGQKINPIGFRIGVNKDWDSRWMAGNKDFAKAAELAVEELQFLDNKDASREYHIDLAKVYVRRGLEEVSK